MKKSLFILLIFFWSIPSGFAQLKTYSFEETEKLMKENPKPVVVFIHTSWCKYCEMMKNTTFKNSEIQKILDDDFYYVSFDAETTKDILFNNHVFRFKPAGTSSGIHELAEALTTERPLVYPLLLILAPDYSVLFQNSGYVDKQNLLSLLNKCRKTD